MRKVLILGMIIAVASGCKHSKRDVNLDENPTIHNESATRAPVDGMAMHIMKEGEKDEKGMIKVKMTFTNISNKSIYFPISFRGGVTYIKEIVPEVEDIDGIVLSGGNRRSARRGCGGRAGLTKDDFVLLEPSAVYSTIVTIDVSKINNPFILQLSRAIYSSDVKLPNMWLGNIKSNELNY